MSDKFDFNQFIRNILRRGFYKWPARSEVLKEARVARGEYKCSSCENIFGPRDVQIDHTEPVVSIDSNPANKINWNNYIKRLYCGKAGLSLMCKNCHKSKTYLENELRRQHKAELAFGKKEKK